MTNVEMLNARQSFRNTYGQNTVGIVTDLANNRSVKTIVKNRKVSKQTVAATTANLTRGTYSPWALKDAVGVYGTAYTGL